MAAPASDAKLIDSFARARILVLGDVMLDRYVYGTVERMSPEAPVQVLRIERDQVMAGGAGNVARNIAALKAKVTLVGLAGADAAADDLRQAVAEHGNVVADLVVDPARRTTEKIRFVSGRYQLLRADSETTGPVTPETADKILARFRAHLEDTDVVVLSDYGKGVLDDRVLAPAIAAAAEAGKIILADPKYGDYARYRGAHVLTPNRREMAHAAGMACDTDEAAVAAARLVIARDRLDAILVTRGSQGMTLVQKGRKAPVHLRAEAREVFDVSGAGDTVVAALAVALARGAELAEAARLANIAAGIVVGKTGTAVVHPPELIAALRAEAVHSTDAKIAPLEVAKDRVAAWRARGDVIGFTNGCFDLIHPGHVSLLAQARAACDRLIVGLNSDASVRRLKGAARPVQNETARAVVLASLAAVDLVIVFDDDTPIPLIETLRPDVLVKGADYAVDQVVGADIVRAYGGKVLLAELSPGHSTSRTIAKLTG